MDRIETFHGATLQHGADSNRIYLMKCPAHPEPELPTLLLEFAREREYGKVFAKVPARHATLFLDKGFREEARVPGYVDGKEDTCFLAAYPDPLRMQDPDAEVVHDILEAATHTPPTPPRPLSGEAKLCPCTPADTPAMAELYRLVFKSYPFPIHDPAYLARTMEENFAYFGIWEGETLVALASSEMDTAARAVEMTDFATNPACRGRGYAGILLAHMEGAMRRRGIRTAFTIARAVSMGMNLVFAKGGYMFGGTLVRNTGIAGCLESMNVWHKPLGKP